MLKEQAKKRKKTHIEKYGHHNGPTDKRMPTLKYKYKMNEPTVNGEKANHEVSDE